MGGVAFGVYYYLRLAKNNDNANNTNENLFILSNMESYVNGTISQNINDYGNFSKVDITSCILDVSKVDITKEGEYTYFVTCNNEKKSKYNKAIKEYYDGDEEAYSKNDFFDDNWSEFINFEYYYEIDDYEDLLDYVVDYYKKNVIKDILED